MCGIFGFTKFKKEDLEKARESLHTLHHRGPDQWNDYFDKDIYIGHQRLSILDLSEHGKQPMITPDEKVIITVNGEIYNFLELKKELEHKYDFKSTFPVAFHECLNDGEPSVRLFIVVVVFVANLLNSNITTKS